METRPAGENYVIFGQTGSYGASFDLTSLDGSNGFRVDGIDRSDDRTSVRPQGDINGDGFGDLIIGSYGGDPFSRYSAGESYVLFGQSSGFGASLSALDLMEPMVSRLTGSTRTTKAVSKFLGVVMLTATVSTI